MASSDPALFDAAQEFAGEVVDTLHGTVSDDSPIRAEVRGDRVLIAALDDEGNTVSVPLVVADEHRLDRRPLETGAGEVSDS